ncbi:hypothetical protein [Paenibacillus ferrarius]|nr:hypothetical protein [Paenibacillus ferrarius]
MKDELTSNLFGELTKFRWIEKYAGKFSDSYAILHKQEMIR